MQGSCQNRIAFVLEWVFYEPLGGNLDAIFYFKLSLLLQRDTTMCPISFWLSICLHRQLLSWTCLAPLHEQELLIGVLHDIQKKKLFSSRIFYSQISSLGRLCSEHRYESMRRCVLKSPITFLRYNDLIDQANLWLFPCDVTVMQNHCKFIISLA